MRFFNGLVGLLAGTGLCATGSEILVGCSNGFHGCAETRTCQSGTGGDAGSGDDQEAGTGGTGAKAGGGAGGALSGAGGAKGGAAGKSGAGTAGEGSPEGGSAGEREPSNGDAGSETVAAAGGMAGEGSGGTAGTSGSAGMSAAGTSGSAGMVDEAPRILATSPYNGQKGVRSDAQITITFSEAMDRTTTEEAFHWEQSPAVTLEWQNHDTVLVIRPSGDLAYASTDLTGDAKVYTFAIDGTATDVGGTPMGVDQTIVFRTLRRVTQKLRLAKGRQSVRSTDGTETVSSTCTVDSTRLFAGDDDTNAGLGFITAFDYAAFAPDVVSWESARLSGAYSRRTAKNPFSRLGKLNAFRLIAPDLEQAKYSSPSALDFGTAASSLSAGAFDLDVVEGLRGAYANHATEGNRFVVLFKFDSVTDNDGEAEQIDASCNQIALDVTYTAP